MNYNFIIDHRDTIIEGLVIAVVGGLLLAALLKVISLISRAITRNPLSKPEDQAIYLNKPQRPLNDICIGRNKLLNEVLGKIKGEEPLLFVGNHVYISGQEGIGKTLFCQTLFNYFLRGAKIYIGWIECNGGQSVFNIIGKTFREARFHKNNESKLLGVFENLEKPCVLFIDQVDQHTPIEDLQKLANCPNITLVISGVLRRISFIDNHRHFTIPPLSFKEIREIFEEKSGEIIDYMYYSDRSRINAMLHDYVKGNPFLAAAFARAKSHNKGTWKDLLENMRKREYYGDRDSYLKTTLRQLYKISNLDDDELSTLAKLSVFSYPQFVKAVFEWYRIPYACIDRLCKTYWLTREDSVLYCMDETHRDVLNKVLDINENIKAVISSVNSFLEEWELYEDRGFRWLSVYVEDILQRVRGYNQELMLDELFAEFTYRVADKYLHTIDESEKALEWLELCNPLNPQLAFDKAYCEFQAKMLLLNSPFTSSEVEQAYTIALEKSKFAKNFRNAQHALKVEYCEFLINDEQYDLVTSICQDYFNIFGFDFSVAQNCDMFQKYLKAAVEVKNEKILRNLANDANISILLQNQVVSITVAWAIGELATVYRQWGNDELADLLTKRMVILLNRQRCFLHHNIKNFLELSEEDFAEYMHSCDELLESLAEAVGREDAEALYLEGRYQEKHNHLEEAFSQYEKAAINGSLRGMCSLALMYYRGQEEQQNYDKARKYWDYCRVREHRGSFYWLGTLLLDESYDGYDEKLALHYLTTAAEMGSERAKQKLLKS